MSKKVSIQVYSDIHLDLTKTSKYATINISLEPQAKYLFLAGNICHLNNKMFFKFLDYCTLRWEKIFFTPGNQEFYSSKKNYGQLDFEYELKIRERYKNIFYLNRKVASLNEDIDVYGCVFWTSPSPELSSNWFLRDYNNIQQFDDAKKTNIPIDFKFMTNLSNTDYEKLSSFLSTTKKKTIIMTHFPPLQSKTSNPVIMNQFEELKNYHAWCDGTLDKMNLNQAVAWISGHTHWSYDIKHANIRLISNQAGYAKEQGQTNFSHKGLYEIDY
jgi:Icc-related predicted phosphoesterase